MDKPLMDDFDESALFSPQAAARPAPRLTPSAAPVAPNANPLAKYFRLPGLHIALPSGGAYLPAGAIQTTMSGEFEVYPMRAADELLLKSPDALMSGFAIEKMIESCVPGIKNPRLVSTPDLDVILLAVRATSYGDKMDIEVNCPACRAENVFACDIPSLLNRMTPLPAENPVRLSPEVVAYVRPYNLANATQISLVAFEETRKMQALDSSSDEIRNKARNESYNRLNLMGIAMSADCILKVVVPEGEVTEPGQIREFFDNVPRDWAKRIEDKLKELNNMGLDKSLDVQCSSCKHEWKTEVEFDPASFFGLDS